MCVTSSHQQHRRSTGNRSLYPLHHVWLPVQLWGMSCSESYRWQSNCGLHQTWWGRLGKTLRDWCQRTWLTEIFPKPRKWSWTFVWSLHSLSLSLLMGWRLRYSPPTNTWVCSWSTRLTHKGCIERVRAGCISWGDWTASTSALGIYTSCMFYQSVISSVISYATVCWGGSAKKKNLKGLNRLVRTAESIVGASLDSGETTVEAITMSKLKGEMSSMNRSLNSALSKQKSSCSHRLLSF